jgi:Protein of unknown function (DUF2959)
MKSTINLLRLTFRCAIGALILLPLGQRAGAGEPELAGQKGKARMDAVRNEVVTLRSNIFLTLVALDRVRGERQPNGPNYQAFTNQLARMEELAKVMGKRTDEMKKRGDAYFADWEANTATIQNPGERQRAEQKYAERKKSYDAIGRFMPDARANFFPFLEELTSIKKLLEGPRDQRSVAEAKDLFMKANWHCIEVQRDLMETEQELDNLGASFSRDR